MNNVFKDYNLKKLRDKKLKNAFYEALYKISENPYIGAQKSGDLATVYGYDVRYNGVNYELAYLRAMKEGVVIFESGKLQGRF